MKFEGESEVSGTPPVVWDALIDPKVIERCTPGCQSLAVVGPDDFELVTKIGIASISGTYKGRMRIAEKLVGERYVMSAEGAGPIGTMSVVGIVTLQDNGDATRVAYSFEATVGGAMPIAKLLTKQFFKRVEKVIAGEDLPAEEVGS